LDLSYNRLKSVEAFAFRSLSNLINLNMENNFELSLTNQSLFGLKYIANIEISFANVANSTDSTNVNGLFATLNPLLAKPLLGREYFYSIFVNYDENEVDCELTLRFIKKKIQLNLKNSLAVKTFFEQCTMFTLQLVQ
jgi:hypothetical protein